MLDRKCPPKGKNINILDLFVPIKPEIFTSENDVKIHVISGASQELCRVEFFFDAGLKHEHEHLQSNFTGKLLLSGTKEATAFQISKRIDQYGAFFNITPGNDRSYVSLYSMNKYLKEVLPVLIDAFNNATYLPEELEVLRNRKKQTYLVNSQRSEIVASRAINSILFPSHPYGTKIDPTDFDKLNRQHLIEFHNDCFRTRSMEIIVSGNVNSSAVNYIAETVGRMTKNHGELQKGKLLPLGDYHPTKNYLPVSNAVQCAICIGKPTILRNHKDFHSLNIATTILGGYFGSRLMNNLREDKGYTYGIHTYLAPMGDAGKIIISTQVAAEVYKNALKEIYFEIEKLQNELVPEHELVLVKNYMTGMILQSMDGAISQADRYKAIYLTNCNTNYYNILFKTINEITSQEIKEIFNKYYELKTLSEVVAGTE